MGERAYHGHTCVRETRVTRIYVYLWNGCTPRNTRVLGKRAYHGHTCTRKIVPRTHVYWEIRVHLGHTCAGKCVYAGQSNFNILPSLTPQVSAVSRTKTVLLVYRQYRSSRSETGNISIRKHDYIPINTLQHSPSAYWNCTDANAMKCSEITSENWTSV
jgi:hypothetical protein